MTILKSPIFLKNVTCSLLLSRVLFWKVSRAIRNCHVKKNTDPKFHHFLPQHGAILLSWRRLPPLGEFLSIHTLAPVNMYNTVNHYPMVRTQGKLFFCGGGGGRKFGHSQRSRTTGLTRPTLLFLNYIKQQ